MSSHSLLPLNIRTNYDSENTKQTKKDSNNSIKRSLTSFKGFSSALFMTEYQGNEENIFSQKSDKAGFSSSSSNSNSNKDKIKFSPSLEKCLTSELLDSITNDSSNMKKWKNSHFNNYEIDLKDFSLKEENPQDFLKITKKLFIQENQEHTHFEEKNKDFKECDDETNFKNKKKISIYEETINRFEYQLKFIENSVHNILPKSYKKLSENSNKSNCGYYNYSNNNNNQIIFPFAYCNENKNNNNNCNYLSYKNLNNDYSNNNVTVSEFEPYDFETDLSAKLSMTKNENNNLFYNIKKNNKTNQFQHQIHKLKISDSYYGDWICNKCNCINRGYRKACSKCGVYTNLII